MTKVGGEVGEGKTDQRLPARQQPPFPLQLQLQPPTSNLCISPQTRSLILFFNIWLLASSSVLYSRL
jgi:hypothetical protein